MSNSTTQRYITRTITMTEHETRVKRRRRCSRPVRTTPLAWPGDPEQLDASDVDFEAVAHVLANTCRWGGRTRRFLSLAQHALTMSEEVEALDGIAGEDRRALALHALLMPAPAAWLGDGEGEHSGIGQGGGARAGAWRRHRQGRARSGRARPGTAGRLGRGAPLRRPHDGRSRTARSRSGRRQDTVPAASTHYPSARARSRRRALARAVRRTGRASPQRRGLRRRRDDPGHGRP